MKALSGCLALIGGVFLLVVLVAMCSGLNNTRSSSYVSNTANSREPSASGDGQNFRALRQFDGPLKPSLDGHQRGRLRWRLS